MSWVDIIMPIAIKLIGWIIPSIGGIVSGPIGWLVSFGLTKLTEYLLDLAKKANIGAEIKKQLNEVHAASLEFFEIEDRRERGEALVPGEREDAKQKLKDAAKKLIQIQKR